MHIYHQTDIYIYIYIYMKEKLCVMSYFVGCLNNHYVVSICMSFLR